MGTEKATEFAEEFCRSFKVLNITVKLGLYFFHSFIYIYINSFKQQH